MYIAPGQGQKAPRGQNFDVNRKALSFYPGFALPVAIVAKCEEKIFFGTKKLHLAKTSGEKKFSSQKIGTISAVLCHLIAN